MQAGAITSYVDVAQITLYAFFIFFFCLVLYLRSEDKREGYPLVPERTDRDEPVEGLPPMPSPKAFHLPNGEVVYAPRAEQPETVAAVPAARWPGAPLQPTGNPMLDGVGPAAYAQRADVPDLSFETNQPKIVPLRVATDFFLEPRDVDPRGMEVVGADRVVAGTVVDVWIDRAETLVRYLETEVKLGSFMPRRVLVPMNMVILDARQHRAHVDAILGEQFAQAPSTQHPEQVTLREEDRITAYFGSGKLYATLGRLGPAFL